jgi:dihydroneopterin aldolase
MAVLAMDQHAHLVASRLTGSALVATPRQIDAALDSAHVPVLAPSRWLRDADPLPHSWEVTSDSIAAWVTGQLGATRLVLVKPPGVRRRESHPALATGVGENESDTAANRDVVDAYFSRTLPGHVTWVVVGADERGGLQAALQQSRS